MIFFFFFPSFLLDNMEMFLVALVVWEINFQVFFVENCSTCRCIFCIFVKELSFMSFYSPILIPLLTYSLSVIFGYLSLLYKIIV